MCVCEGWGSGLEREGWNPGLGTPGPARKGWRPAPGRPGPALPPPSRPVAAPTGQASLDTSPITLYLCFTLLFFFPSLIIVSLWGRQRI